MRSSCFGLLSAALLTLAFGCHGKHTDPLTAPGQPPVIITNPADTTTVSGRTVSLTVNATGAPTLQFQWAKDGINVLGASGSTYTLPNPKVSDSGKYTVTVTNPNGTITSAAATLTIQGAVTFVAPVSVVVDASGNLFVSDMDDHTIWKVSPSNQRTLFAGSPGLQGSLDGKGDLARFNTPGGLALDSAGNLFVADTGNHTIRRIAPDGTVTTLAGLAGTPGSADGAAATARFNAPYGVAVDALGAVYIADTQNHTIRLLSAAGTVSTLAGLVGQPGQVDGASATAKFSQPNGLAIAPNGTLYIADFGNSVIRALSPSGTVSLFAGNYNAYGLTDGAATTAVFYQPVGLALDGSGTLYVADTNNGSLRKISPAGTVTTLAGPGTSGNVDGLGAAAYFLHPCGVALTPSGNLVVADTGNHQLRSITPAGQVSTYLVPVP